MRSSQKTEPNYPKWITEIVDLGQPLASYEAGLELAIALSAANPSHGGGPFGAIVTDSNGRILGIGVNTAVEDHNPTAHAELNAIVRACHAARSHDPSATLQTELTLCTSCEPCILCFGAIWWANIRHVYWAASHDDAESIGFAEGPVTDELWNRIQKSKGTEAHPVESLRESAVEVLKAYVRDGGLLY